MRMDGKVVIVTGAYRGIGRAVAERLADEGAEVLAVDVVPGAEFDRSAISFRTMDVSRLDEWEDLAGHARDRFGRLDGLVNVAGVMGDMGGPEDFDLDEYHRTIAINQTGTLYGMRVAIPLMRCMQLSTSRSHCKITVANDSTSNAISPARTLSPSFLKEVKRAEGSLCRKIFSATSMPASTASCFTFNTALPRAVAEIQDRVE